MLSPENRTTEELLLPRGAFRDSAFSASTDQSHDVAVLWTGTGAGVGGGELEGVKEGEGEGEEVDEVVEARSPDVTRTIYEESRPKSERAELALATPPLPSTANDAAPENRSTDKDKVGTETRRTSKDRHTRRPSKSGTPSEWVFVSVDKGKGGSESSGSPPLDEMPPSPPPLATARKGSFKRWFGGGEAAKKTGKPKTKATRRRGGMVQALRSSRRLTIE
jgi:hypothetical protein